MPKKIMSIDHAMAKGMMDLAVSAIKSRGVPGAVAIVDSGGHLIALERLDGTMYAASAIAMGKAATAVAFQRPTKDLEDTILNGRSPMLMLDSATPQPYVPLKGGYPIVVEGQVLGGIAIAGTMDADLDETIALEALKYKI